MDQLRNFADDRLLDGCIYCGTQPDTKDHVPSRVLLDRPLPTNLPVLPACFPCNNGFSSDEEYVACLLEVVMVGSTEPDCIVRPVVADILRRSPGLRSRLETARNCVNGQVTFEVDNSRVENVLLKLARGHAAYELSALCRGRPNGLRWNLLSTLSEVDRQFFEEVPAPELFSEVGSRGMQRLAVAQFVLQSPTGERSTIGFLVNDWIEVQEGRYRYLVTEDGAEIRVRIVLGEFLYCDASWNREN
jgi:hypothetical protein